MKCAWMALRGKKGCRPLTATEMQPVPGGGWWVEGGGSGDGRESHTAADSPGGAGPPGAVTQEGLGMDAPATEADRAVGVVPASCVGRAGSRRGRRRGHVCPTQGTVLVMRVSGRAGREPHARGVGFMGLAERVALRVDHP